MRETAASLHRYIGYVLSSAALAALVAAPILSSEVTTAYADEADDGAQEQREGANKPTEKQETVYAYADANGAVTKTTVSAWLKNGEASNLLVDVTNLSELENAKGDESFKENGDHVTWEAKGNDIYLKGASKDSLPITLAVSYQLDGKTVSAEELAGKSGKVSITYSFSNDSFEYRTVGGKTAKIYTPFLTMTGLTLPKGTFENVEVDNGKVIADGERSVVVGYAMPGMHESLGLDDLDVDDIDVPDSFTVTADVRDFELGESLTMISGDMLNDANTDDLGLAKLQDSMSELQKAMDKLIEGGDTLVDALDALADGSEKLAEGTGALNTQVAELPANLEALDQAGSGLSEGAAQLLAGNEELNSKLKDAAALANAIDSDVNQGSADAEGLAKRIETAKKSAKELDKSIGSLQESLVGDSENPGAAKRIETAATQIQAGLTTLSSDLDQVSEELGQLGNAEVEVDTADAEDALAAAKDAAGTAKDKAGSAGSGVSDAKTDVSSAKSSLDAAGVDKLSLEGIDLDGLSNDDKQKLAKLVDDANVDIADNNEAVSDAKDSLTDASTNLGSAETDASAAASAAGTASSKVDDAKDKLSSLSGTVTLGTEQKQAIDAIIAKLGSKDQDGTLLNDADKLVAAAKELSDAEANLVSELDDMKAKSEALVADLEELEGDDGLKKVADETNQLSQGLNKISKQVDERLLPASSGLSDGADQMDEALSQLDDAAPAMAEAVNGVDQGAQLLAEGNRKVAKGAGTFSDGLKEFDEKGIQKIIDLFDGDLGGLTDRMDAMIEMGRAYDNFSGKPEGTKSSVSFVIQVDSIELPEED